MTSRSSETLAALGRAFYGLPMAAFGVAHLFYGDFVTRFAPGWPAWAPGRPIAARVVGALLLAAGLAVASGKRTRTAAFVLGALIALSLVFAWIPKLAANASHGGAWTGPVKYLALLGGSLLIAGIYPDRGSAAAIEASTGKPIVSLVSLARILLGVFLTLCGVQHFIYLSFVATLVPSWIPPQVFWAQFAGVALIAGGIGLWIPRTQRLAATLSGLMIFTWFLIVHIPRSIEARDIMEWSGVFESLAFAGIAFLVAATSQATASAGEAAAPISDLIYHSA